MSNEKKIESLTDVLARAEAAQRGNRPLNPLQGNPNKAEQAKAGQEWLRNFQERDWPSGEAHLEKELYDCVLEAARTFRNEWGLRMQWTSPHTIKYRGIRIALME